MFEEHPISKLICTTKIHNQSGIATTTVSYSRCGNATNLKQTFKKPPVAENKTYSKEVIFHNAQFKNDCIPEQKKFSVQICNTFFYNS